MLELLKPFIKAVLQILMPEEAGVLETGAEHPLPAVLHELHVRRSEVENGHEVRQEVARGIFQAKALLVHLHAGHQNFAGHFQIDFVKITEKGNRMFDEVAHFIEQSLGIEHAAAYGLCLPVSTLDDNSAAFGAVQHEAALLRYDVNVVTGGRDLERTGSMDAVPAGGAAALHRPDFEGHDAVIEQRQNPVHGTGIGEGARPPAHTLREGHAGNDAGADIGQDIARTASANRFLHSHVLALRGLDGINILHFHAVGAGEPFQSLAGHAVLPGDAGGRSGDLLLTRGLHGRKVVNDDGGAARRGVHADGAVLQEIFFQGRVKRLGEIGLLPCQEAGGKLFSADFQNKSSHSFFSLLLEHGIAHILALLGVKPRDTGGQGADPADIGGAFRDGDGAAGIQQIERVRALHALVIGRPRQSHFHERAAFLFVIIEMLEEHGRVAAVEVVLRLLHFVLVVDVAVSNAFIPSEIVDAVHALQIHGDAFEAVGDFHGSRRKIQAAHLLEIRELAHFHAVEPDFPAEAPGAQSGRFPVILHKTDVVFCGVDAEGAKAAKVEILGVFRVGLHNDLELEVPLQTVGVLAVASVLGTAAGFHICNTPRFRSEHAQKCVRVESTRTALDADGLFDNAAVLAPVALERHDYVLKEHENLSLAERPTRAGNGPAPR